MSEAMHNTGVWKLEYPRELKEAVDETAKAWEAFCALPDATQDLMTSDNLFNGSGFERKVGVGTAESRFSHDKKLNFDITARDVPALMKNLDTVQDEQQRDIVKRFLAAASSLAHEAPGVIAEFGKEVENKLDVTGFHELAQSSAPDAFFRCLYYPPAQSVDEVIGEPHVDNSGFTLHLFESTDGCQALSRDGISWTPMPVADGQALAFPSMQTQLYSKGKIDGLCHRILANETTHAVGRMAIVCFVALKNMPVYDRMRHGRLQEMAPGFNYGMEAREFTELFMNE